MAISIRERRAQGALQRWLRRTALASIPMIGLCGCGDSCEITHQSQDGQTDGGVVWAAGSQHPAADCGPYCWPGYHDPCFDTVLTGCLAKNAAGALTCQYEMTRCVPQPCGEHRERTGCTRVWTVVSNIAFSPERSHTSTRDAAEPPQPDHPR